MIAVFVVWGALGLLFLFDGLRIRGRAASLTALTETDAEVADDHRFLCAPGVTLDDATKRAASAHAKAEGLAILDLVPGDTNVSHLWNLAQLFDPGDYRHNRIAPGRTAAHAVLVTEDVFERARVEEGWTTVGAFVAMALKLKRYATTSADFAVAPGLRALPRDPFRRRDVLHAVLGGMDRVILIGQPLIVAILVLGVVLDPIAGAVAVGAFHLQQPIALAGHRALRVRGVLASLLFRTLLELWSWLRLVSSRVEADGPDPVESRRPEYEALMADGVERFVGEPVGECPLCAGKLTTHLKNGDLVQHKPGTFTLDRCVDCGHIFQNPRLTLDGLAFYYRDFYDGLGEEELEGVFAWGAEPYFQRARMVEAVHRPERWLDVGCGHGHFCLLARDVFPDARFDGLDLSESIEEAKRRQWVDEGFRGLFPQMAGELAGRYDVVSMSHYLEHTLDPRDELDAAAEVLGEGGLLLIELPDPESPFGRWLGRLWLPWFQPQHLHLLSTKNLDRLLEERGFESLVWHRAEAHQKVDLMFATYLWLRRIAKPVNVPWRPRPSVLGRLWHGLVWAFGSVLLLSARMTDRLIAPWVLRRGASNTYRVVARKVA